MTTVSYPAEGNNGFNVAQWARRFSAEDGIIGDTVGNAGNLTVNNTTNTATISPVMVSVNGYVLDVTAAHDVNVPTAAGAYFIAAKYDPALNVADGSGNADPLGPVRLVCATSLSTAAGEAYVLLWDITRTSGGQLLTAAPKRDFRKWVGVSVEMNSIPVADELDQTGRNPLTGFNEFPRGSMLFDRSTGNIYRLTLNDPGTELVWVSITDTDEVAFPNNSPLVAVDAAPMMRKVAGEVMLRGTLKRSSGADLSTGNEVLLGTLPAGYRPSSIRRFICYGNGWGTTQAWAPVKVLANGEVIMYDPMSTVVWIDLSSIQFRAA